MRRIAALSLAMAAMSACLFRSSPQGPVDDLTALATRVNKVAYTAIYTFGITGQLAGGVSTRMEIAQSPPSSLRRLETTTQPKVGKPITVTSWLATNANGHYACTQLGGANRCVADPVANGTFGDAQIDAFFDTPRQAKAFKDVRKDTRPVRIRGERGTCFEAAPVTPSEPPVRSPQPTLVAERFRYEVCYTDDGILLRGRRTNLAEAEAGGPSQTYVLEIVSISRVVEPRDLHLPGPIVHPEDLKP